MIENYASASPKYLCIFVKQTNKVTLIETFEEAINIEKNSLTYEPKRRGKFYNVMCPRMKHHPSRVSKRTPMHLMLKNFIMLSEH